MWGFVLKHLQLLIGVNKQVKLLINTLMDLWMKFQRIYIQGHKLDTVVSSATDIIYY